MKHRCMATCGRLRRLSKRLYLASLLKHFDDWRMPHPRDLTNLSSSDFAVLQEVLPEGWHPSWRSLAEVFYMGLLDTMAKEMPREKMAQIAKEQVLTTAFQIGGRHFYMPAGVVFTRQQVAQSILKDFNGRNYDELAAQHGLSAMRIRQIVQESRSAKQPRKDVREAVPKRPNPEIQPEGAAWPFKRL